MIKIYFTRQNHFLLIVSCIVSPITQSEVTLDGSMGASGALSGPNYQITEDLGQRTGNNLFHSFGQFNINSSESATFSGSASIQNVVSRVTGGQVSTIDGAFRSTIPGANIYFINPSGVIFGENASLDMQGSFHASTADYLKFKDGVKFETGIATANPILTTAAPEAFGFLDNTPASISVLGENKTAILEVKKDATLSLVGGEVTLKNGHLFTPSGQINIVSVGSTGEATIADTAIGTASFNKMGEINVVSNLPNHISIASQSDSAGKIFIRGGQMTMDNTVIFTATEQGKGGDIDIGLTGDLNITNSQSNSKTTLNISSATRGIGDGGNINLKTAGLNLSQGSQINTLTRSIDKEGKAGNINIDTTNTITLSGEATGITSTTAGKGQSGNIRIDSKGDLNLSKGALLLNTSISEGNAGNIEVHAKKVFLSDTEPAESRLSTLIASTSPTGTGNSGNITINTDLLNVQDYAIIKTNTGGLGDAGSIIIDTDHLEMRNGGKIQGTTIEDAGNAGRINIDAKTMLLSGDDSRDVPGQVTTISTQSFNNNSDSIAGHIDIKARVIEIRDGATITVGTSGQSNGSGGSIKINAGQIYAHNGAEINSTTLGLRQGGNIELEAKEILLSGEDTRFQAATDSIKKAGDLSIKSDSLILQNGAEINTNTVNYGRGGDLTISVNTLEMNNKASIEANTIAGGQGGNLTVDAKTILLVGENTKLSSRSFFGSGNAGNLTVSADQIKLKDLAAFSAATSGLGEGGDISVEAKIIFLSNSDFITNSHTSSLGDAGDLTVNADHLVLEENALIRSDSHSQGIDSYITALDDLAAYPEIQPSFIDSLTPHIEEHRDNIGNAGNVTINAGQLEIKDDSRISAFTFGKGQGGNLNVNAHSIFITRNNSKYITGLYAQSRSEEDNAGDAGNIFVNTDHLEVHSGALITTGTKGSGHGGSLTIDANTILLSGDGSDHFTGIKSEASNNNSGNAGSLIITASNQLDIRDNAGISSNIFGTGQGELMQISANNINLDNANISSASHFSGNIPEGSDLAKSGKIGQNRAKSGKIDITVNDTLTLKNNSLISVNTKKANAGEINISSKNILNIADSSITTSVANGEGNGGNINVNSSIVSLDSSQIVAQAKKGTGGKISVSGFLFKSPRSVVDASSELSTDGELNLKPVTNISGAIAVLPESLLNASEHLSDRCGNRSEDNKNSFLIKSRGGVPLSPGKLAPSALIDITTPIDHHFGSTKSANKQVRSLTATKHDKFLAFNQQVGCRL